MATDFLFGVEVEEGQGLVGADEVGPAEVGGGAGCVDFFVTEGGDTEFGDDVGSNIAYVEGAGLVVDRDAVRVADAHAVNFWRTVFTVGEEVVCGDGVTAVGGGVDSEDFPAQIARVGGGALCVPALATGARVDGETGVVVAVVAVADVEVAFGVHPHGASHVEDVFGVVLPREEDAFGGGVHALITHREPADAHGAGFFGGAEQREQVPGFDEIFGGGESEEADFAFGVGRDGAEGGDEARGGVPNFDGAPELDEKDAPVGQALELEGVAAVGDEDFLFEACGVERLRCVERNGG